MDVEAQRRFHHQRRRHVLSHVGSSWLMSGCKALSGLIKALKKKIRELAIYVVLFEIVSVSVEFFWGKSWPSLLVTLLLAALCLFVTIYDHERGRTTDAIASREVLKIMAITFSRIQLLDKLIRFIMLTVLDFKRINYNIEFVFTLTFAMVDAWKFVFHKDVDEPTQQEQPHELGLYGYAGLSDIY